MSTGLREDGQTRLAMTGEVIFRALLVSTVLLLLSAWRLEPALAGDDAALDRAADLIEALKGSSAAERPILVHKLIRLGPQALEATRAARDATADPEVAKALGKAVTWQVAAQIVPVLEAGLETQLTFDGQYSSLSRLGNDGVRALLALVDDSATGFLVRVAACRALADVGDSSLLPAIRELRNDILLPARLREQLGTIMATFGDTYPIENELQEYLRLSRHKDPLVRLEVLERLSNLYYRIRNYEKAVEYYEEILDINRKVLEVGEKNPIFPRPVLSSLRDRLTLNYYNAACSNALHRNIDRCKQYLREAVRRDPIHYDNIGKDGDLRNLTEHPSYGKFREELGKLFEGQDL